MIQISRIPIAKIPGAVLKTRRSTIFLRARNQTKNRAQRSKQRATKKGGEKKKNHANRREETKRIGKKKQKSASKVKRIVANVDWL
jgi:hypothetical protein